LAQDLWLKSLDTAVSVFVACSKRTSCVAHVARAGDSLPGPEASSMPITSEDWDLVALAFSRTASEASQHVSSSTLEESRTSSEHLHVRTQRKPKSQPLPWRPGANLPQRSQVHSMSRPVQHVQRSQAVGVVHPTGRQRKLQDEYNFIARGHKRSSGIVRQAEHDKTNRRVTVKSCGMLTQDADQSRVISAAMEAHGQLDHEHIVKVEDIYVDVTSSCMHFVMEHLAGGDLCDALSQCKRFSEKNAKVVVLQLLNAVEHMHQHQVVHRDIKLESIMFVEAGGNKVKLIDFGLAAEWDGRSEMSQRCGTAEFSSPEMMRGKYTEKTDMWSVGVVAYMLLTGERLYRGSDWDIHAQAKTGSPLLHEKLYECSAAASDFVSSLLVRNPAQRLSVRAALRHAWLVWG